MDKRRNDPDHSSRSRMVQAALQEIMVNYREANLGEVARSQGVSLAYVSECVREETGRTYKELLQNRRLELAGELLRGGSMNVQQVIEAVGYENASYFYRLFQRHYGISPRQYRLQAERRKERERV